MKHLVALFGMCALIVKHGRYSQLCNDENLSGYTIGEYIKFYNQFLQELKNHKSK